MKYRVEVTRRLEQTQEIIVECEENETDAVESKLCDYADDWDWDIPGYTVRFSPADDQTMVDYSYVNGKLE